MILNSINRFHFKFSFWFTIWFEFVVKWNWNMFEIKLSNISCLSGSLFWKFWI